MKWVVTNSPKIAARVQKGNVVILAADDRRILLSWPLGGELIRGIVVGADGQFLPADAAPGMRGEINWPSAWTLERLIVQVRARLWLLEREPELGNEGVRHFMHLVNLSQGDDDPSVGKLRFKYTNVGASDLVFSLVVEYFKGLTG